ncbi:hypothetical protein APY04_2952 [Hyphomicrobium sulfonivorans]|uniref:Beta-lactamase-related domain-containing protein n=1 Tax=Hyphomicrobium sulfonivorans TaxID=121290 RepID=A0A125NU14_HYPSL|nr:serine hydrolase domain-containing protein [Hyphomicrobium sulfonivorans]KWT65203.1 hypothetical protein APY04_2952 [Hyphomicrobium sulfonivorans]
MLRYSLSLVWITALMISLPSARHARAGEWSAYDTAQFDILIDKWRKGGKQPRRAALSVAIGINGELVFARGYGEARPGQIATERTVYHIGSLSKQFTAAAMLNLIDKAPVSPRSLTPLSLASTVDAVLPGFENWSAPEIGSPVTIRRLLTMTSGLPSLLNRPPPGSDPWGRISSGELISALKALRPSARPKVFAYDNFNYFVLSQIIETVSCRSPDANSRGFMPFVRSMLLTPLALDDTGFVGDPKSYRAARVATPSWGNTPSHMRRPAFVQSAWLQGAADMASSATDLFKWNRAIMRGTAVTPANRQLMFSNAARVTLTRYYGMGWFIDHDAGWDWFTHTGFVPGYTASNAIVQNPVKGHWISVTLLTNADGMRELEKLSEAIVRIAKRHLPLVVAQPSEPRPALFFRSVQFAEPPGPPPYLTGR